MDILRHTEVIHNVYIGDVIFYYFVSTFTKQDPNFYLI